MTRDLSQMSGESASRRPKATVFDEIKIDGAGGKFVKTMFTKPKDKMGKFETEEIGEKAQVVFLKIRRKLIEFQKDRGLVRSTSEHNVGTDTVMMWGDDSQKGVANDLRTKFPMLRTQQLIYCIDVNTKQTVKLQAKGASLGSEQKTEGVLKFYEYLQSFGKEEHFYEYITELNPIKEKSALGQYYAITFSRGTKLTEAQMEKVGDAIEMIYEDTKAQDEYYGSQQVAAIKKDQATAPDIETIEYPADDINAEDIPF